MTDIIVKADDGLTHVENEATKLTGESVGLLSNLITHFNAFLASVGSEVKVGISAAESGIGGTANLVVSTEDLLKAAAPAAAPEPLAAPPATATTAG